MERHYTATVYIFHQGKVLLLFHKKHNLWMPPGGHVELNETPDEAARRETFEETGVEIEFITQENVWFDYPHATSLVRPYHMQLETIPAHKNEPAHQHIDLIFLAKAKTTDLLDGHWHTLEEALQLEMFPDAHEMLKHLFTSEMAIV